MATDKKLIHGRLINVHPESACEGRPCVIHRPSDHHMKEWPLNFRNGMFDFIPYVEGRPVPLTERLCSHGVGHPDPDSLAFLEENGVHGYDVHGCDGCCNPSSIKANFEN